MPKDWKDLLAIQLTDDDKDELEEKGNMRSYKPYIQYIIHGKKMHMEGIITYLNFVGDRDKRKTNTFKAMTLDEFESEYYRKNNLFERWEKLSGIAIVQNVRNRHFLSVFISSPNKKDGKIVGYDSKKNYNDSRDDLSGETCSTIRDDAVGIEALIKRVARTAGEIKRENTSPILRAQYDEMGKQWDDWGWEIIRSFVSQEDAVSCGVLTCLFLECMKYGYKFRGAKRSINKEMLEEYRWGIAKTCYEYRIKDHTIPGRVVDGGEL
jgi:hypothetical protein